MPGVRRSFPAALLTASLSLLLVVLAGGFAAAALVRFSPGFDVDENSWNPRIGAETAAVLHAARVRENRLPTFYFHYLRAAFHGDLGASESFQTPVSQLLRERAPVSAGMAVFGTAGGLFTGLIFAWLTVWPRRAWVALPPLVTAGLLLAVPPAVLALAFWFSEAPLWLAVALAILPRVFGTFRTLLEDFYRSPSLLAARTRGVPWPILALRYVARPALPQLGALTGVALVFALGALIPIEALCDVPGIGQLAWKAAVSRDLPLLSGLALIITFVTALVHLLGELAA